MLLYTGSMQRSIRRVLAILMVSTLCLLKINVFAQSILDRKISLDIRKKPLKEALTAISKQGDFYFSYNSSLLNNDSIVSISVKQQTVREALTYLLGNDKQFKATDKHVIIQPVEKEKWFTVSGYVIDERTGEKVPEASVFEQQQLAATLTDERGYFKLRLKDREKYAALAIRVSKGFYRDTILFLGQGFDQQIIASISPSDFELPGVVITQYSATEKSWFGKFLLSKKVRKQSSNLGKFFTEKPVQVSLTPGLGSHGKMSGQVTNKLSFNVLGGYTAGVDGFELGGLFNINKKDVKYTQVAGVFNLVSGNVTGVQVAGIMNSVNGGCKGVQVSGIISHIHGPAKGVVVSGITSHAADSLKGMQISGIVNFIYNNHVHPSGFRGMQIAGITNNLEAGGSGMQLAGITNRARRTFTGVQLSGIVNKARHIRGVQIGLVNIVDTLDGYSLGFINIVKSGYHTICLYKSELLDANIAYKAGNRRLYSILYFGFNTQANERAFSYGYGIGSETKISGRLALTTDLLASHLYLGNADIAPSMVRLEPALNVRLFKWLGIFAGPSIAYCPSVPQAKVDGYLPGLPPRDALYTHVFAPHIVGWVGWRMGLNLL